MATHSMEILIKCLMTSSVAIILSKVYNLKACTIMYMVCNNMITHTIPHLPCVHITLPTELFNYENTLEVGGYPKFGGLKGRSQPKQDPPIERDLMLTLEEVYNGCIKKMEISRKVCEVNTCACYIHSVLCVGSK